MRHNFSFSKLNKPFVIAEMSANHQQSLSHALDIVEAAAQCGVDAIKLQTFTPETMTLDLAENEFRISDPKSLWYGSSLYDLYKEASLPWEWHEAIFKKSAECGLLCFSTPFDFTAVDFLETLHAPIYKIASFEITHLPLIKKVAATGKPIIISTGMASIAEITEAVNVVRSQGNNELALLKCTSCYPANHSFANLKTLQNMKEIFKCTVGISDHTPGIGAAVASVALGGMMIEKHFTLSRKDGGLDAEFSLEPHEMKSLVEEVHRAYESIGEVHYGLTASEVNSLQFRRSIYVAKDLKKGESFTPENIKVIRPSFGLAPKYYESLIEKKCAKEDIKKGTALTWEQVD
jgi:pseudaminic acid synthase